MIMVISRINLDVDLVIGNEVKKAHSLEEEEAPDVDLKERRNPAWKKTLCTDLN